MGLDEKGAATLPLLRFVAAHLASQAMRRGVLDPLLADLQFDRELTLAELSGRAAQLRAAGDVEQAARLDVEWHKKPVLGTFCLAMALCGAAITRLLRRPWTRYVSALAVAAIAYALLRLGEQAADAGRLAPALGMWGPVALVAASAGLVLVRRPWALEAPAVGT